MLVSVVITVFNEEDNIADLLDSLVTQEGPLEVIVVDAHSRDKTRDIVQRYCERYPFVKLHEIGGKRGRSRNAGIKIASGEAIAFVDGDAICNPFWAPQIRKSLAAGADVVAGKTINIGLRAWEALGRVELFYKGHDVTYPSCNIAYRAKVLQDIKGFDEWFITAEDIDMNLRAVEAGFILVYNPEAIVYHRTKSTVYRFFKQAFWNGAGRKQLTMKHGRLWSSYDPMRMFRQKMTFWSFSRMVVAIGGYVGFKFFGDKAPYKKS